MKVLRVICNLLLCRCNEKKDENKEDVENQPRDEHTLEELIQDDNFNLPISIALLILVIYILVGCFVFPMWVLAESFVFHFYKYGVTSCFSGAHRNLKFRANGAYSIGKISISKFGHCFGTCDQRIDCSLEHPWC